MAIPKTLLKMEAEFFTANQEELKAAKERADETKTHHLTLGEGQRQKLLAATKATSIQEIIDNAVVIKRMKCAALIKVHNLLYLANRYGVMICKVPSGISIKVLSVVEGPGIRFAGGEEILNRLGATRHYDGRDYIYDYSQCVEQAA